MQVHYDEGIANRIGPEPCVVGREAGDEASAGVRIGQPLSRERIIGTPTPLSQRKAKRGCASTRAHLRSCVVEDPGMCVSSSIGNRETSTLAARELSGPHREGDEPKPMMHGGEGSDSAIVAVKRANEAGRPAEEFVEPRAGAEGNAGRKARAGHRTGKACHRRWNAYARVSPSDTRRWEPDALIGPVRLCAGGAQQ